MPHSHEAVESEQSATSSSSSDSNAATLLADVPKWELSSMWKKDESIQAIYAEIEQKPTPYRCISFDFFDTLVARFCPEPIALFVEVGRRLTDLGLLNVPVTSEEYRNLRIAAENKARNLAILTESKIDISIAQIYTHLQYVVSDTEQAARIELQVEKERCYLNPCMTQLLKYARSHGILIAVLSDTYYSADDLYSILHFNGFDTSEIDLLLTSCDVGATKANGELFQFTLSRLGIQPSEMIHIGDNWEADYRGALQVDIKAFYYYRTTPYINEVLQRERRTVNAWPALSSGLDSLRVLAQRLDGHIGEDKAYYQDGAFLLGPVMARFADWCLEQFQKAGITRILALMREGEFLGKMLECAASARGIYLEVVPCYTSRKATHLAWLGEATSLNLNLRMMQRNQCTVREILKFFCISHCDISDVLTQAELEIPLDSPEIFSKLENIIRASSAAARSLLMDYLGSLVEGHSQIGIVDLGWHCTIQHHLVNILHQVGCPIRIMGCYLATHKYACDLVLNGAEVRGYLGNMGTREVFTESLMRSPEFLEQTISACIGSTERYRVDSNGKVEPVLGSLHASEEECKRKRLVQEGILTFQKIWLSVLGTKLTQVSGESLVFPQMLEEIDRYNLAIIHRLVTFPTRQEACRFGSFHHDDNFGSDPWQLICNDNMFQALREGGFLDLYQNSRTYWPQGLMAMERPEVVRQLLLGWDDLAGLGRLGAWPHYEGEFLPYSYKEKDVLEELLREHKPGLVVIFGNGNTAVRRWLLNTLSCLPESDVQEVERAVIEAVRHSGNSSNDNDAVPHLYHQLMVGNFDSESFVAKVEKEVRHLPQAKRVFIYMDHSCGGKEVERVLNSLAARLGSDGVVVVVGHGGNDVFELGEPQSAYMSAQKWFEESGQSHGFLRKQNPVWPAELFTIFQKDSGVVHHPKIIVDGVIFQLYKTGIAHVWEFILTKWVENGFAKYIVVLDRAETAPKIPGIRYRKLSHYNYNLANAERKLLQLVCDKEEAELFISTYYTIPISTPSVFIVDEMQIELTGGLLNHPISWRQKQQAIQYASAYVASSEKTAHNLIKYFPNISLASITVVPCSVKSTFSPATYEKIGSFKTKYNIAKDYFLLASTEFEENELIFFFKAFSNFLSKQNLEIVFIGSGYLLEADFKACTVDSTVHRLQLNDEELRTAYSGAVALVYLSKHERLGLPLLEAIACGCPTITYLSSSTSDALGQAAIYVDDEDVDGLGKALCDVQKPTVRNPLIKASLEQAKKLSWSIMAKTVCSVSINATLLSLKLQDTNLIVFPDWSGSQEKLELELAQLIKFFVAHPDKRHITLLIDTSNISEGNADLMLSSVSIFLLMEEDLNVNEGPVISLVGQLNEIQWEALLPRIYARIILENENQQAIAQARAEKLRYCKLDSIIDKQFIYSQT